MDGGDGVEADDDADDGLNDFRGDEWGSKEEEETRRVEAWVLRQHNEAKLIASINGGRKLNECF